MRAPVVVETYPIPDDAIGVLQGLEEVTMRALVFEGSDDPLLKPESLVRFVHLNGTLRLHQQLARTMLLKA
jgi:hypothetical protein